MKKRITISLLLLAALTVLSVSCQRNEITAGDGTTKDVSISIALPSGLLVKSQDNPGDGSMVNRCILEIYEDGVLYGERLYADISSLSASFMTRLTTGKTYTFVLWADCADGNAADGFSDIYYNTADGLTSITVNPEAYTNNNDGLDAFYGTFSQQVDNTSELSFTLKRPFGQLNIITLDAATAGIDIADVEARVSFSEVPAGFNALEGTVSADRIQITPAVFSPSVNMATEGTEPGEETQLTFDYLFASQETEETLINFTLELQSNGQAICPPYDASNIPMVRNYKTNVKSDFITSGIEIVVDIDPMFDDNGEEPAPAISITTEDPLALAADGGSYTIEYEITDPAEDGSISADAGNAGWITDINCDTDGAITFSVAANDTEEERQATITVTYTYNGTETVSESIKAVQEANEPPAPQYDFEYEMLKQTVVLYKGNPNNFYMNMSSNADGDPYGAATYTLDLYAESSTLPAGTYTMTANGGEDMTASAGFSSVKILEESGTTILNCKLKEGTITITYEGSTMILDAVLTDAEGNIHHVTYN